MCIIKIKKIKKGVLMNFRYKLMQFMSGRYGVDTSFYVIVTSAVVIEVINCFIFFMPLRYAIQLVVYGLMFFALFRMFSRNIEARRRENAVISGWVGKIKKKIDTNRQRRADYTHIYRKCPNCKATLRLPRRPGKHTTVCPKCGNSFSVKVRK